MSIDTKVAGNPESIRGVASWLRESLERGVSNAATQIYNNRNSAAGGWQGSAADAFCSKMATAGTKTDDLSAATVPAAEGIDTFAADLQRAQDDMRSIRQQAAAAGLTVNGDIIEDPGPGPAEPGDAPTGRAATAAAKADHEDAVAAADTHSAKVAAYNKAKTDSDYSKHLAKLGADTLANVYKDVTQKWFITVGDLTSAAAGTLAAKHSSILRQQSTHLTDEASRLVKAARTAPAGTSPSLIYRDFDAGRAAAYQADDVGRTAKNVDAGASKWAFRAGGALAVAGVAYDISTGKPVGQAVASGGAGFAASVAAGAAIGTAIPVPVVGTAVGAVGGAVAGVFVSGAVDSVWQNGIGDVGGAISDGAEAVGNAGEAIGGLAEDAWDAVF